MDKTLDILKRLGHWCYTWGKNTGLLFYYSGREFFRDHCPIRAAALTYFTLLSLIPLLVIVFAFFKTFGGEVWIDDVIKPLIFKVLSTGTGEVISNAIDELVSNAKAGALGSVGFVFLLLTAFSLIEQVESTMNAIWGVKSKRIFIQRWVFYWAALTIFPLLVGLSLSVSAYLGSLKEVQELSSPLGYKILPLLLQGLAFFLLYIILPRTKVRFFSAFTGALIALILWEFFKKGYLLYSSNAINYNFVYGSLAALPLFMIWLFISWLVVLLGAEIVYASQNFITIRQRRKSADISTRLFEAISLDIILESTRNFMKDGSALDPETFARRQSFPFDLVNNAMNKLSSAGIIRRLNGQVVLSRDPETLTIDEILNAVRSGGDDSPPFAQSESLKQLSAVLEEISQPSRELSSKMSVKQLLKIQSTK